MPNTKLDYLYRDGGNYKRWASIIFSNPEELTIEQIETLLQGALFDRFLFVAHQIRIPEVFLFERGQSNSDDHCFHELAGIEETLEAPTDQHNRSILMFVREVNAASQKGWNVFDPSVQLLW